jgi:tetratricopeptide (TPR) repeat protein
VRPRIRVDIAARPDFRDPTFMRAVGWSLPVSALFGGLVMVWTAGLGRGLSVLAGMLAFAVTLVFAAGTALALAAGSARGLTSFLAPSGGGSPSEDDWSYEKSLLARGQVDEAVTALEVRLANDPDDAALCLFLADVYARNAGDAAKAERLFVRARETPGAAKAHDYQATTRLVDLYLGPLDDPARAAVELERMRTRHAGTQGAFHAETALKRLARGG